MSGFDRWSSPESLVGTVLEGRYEIVRLLGTGGMGAVYEGRHRKLDKQVAVKVLAPGLAAAEKQRKRFLREARAANRIAQDNIVEILDFGEDPVTFFVMEYLEGVDLAGLIEQVGPLPWERARRIMLQILDALGAAHAAGVIHRDMKPSNCFLPSRSRTPDFVKVLDFGIAKVAESSPETRGLTRTNEVMGTVSYMSPEQAVGNVVDIRTDIYASGIVLYELLTGRVPFEGTNSYQVLDKQVREPPPPLRSINSSIPEAVEALTLKALEKDPVRRYQNTAEFRAALEFLDHAGHVAGTVDLPPEQAPEPVGQTQRLPPDLDHASPATERAATGPPDTTPSQILATDPAVAPGGRRGGTRALLALAGAFALAAGGGGAAYAAGLFDPRPTAEASPPAAVEAPSTPAEPPSDEDALVIGNARPEAPAPSAPAPQPDAPSSAGTNPQQVDPVSEAPASSAVDPPASAPTPSENTKASPVSGPKKGRHTRKRSSAKGKSPQQMAAQKLKSLKKRAKGQCGAGAVGGQVVVTFVIRPDGGTSLVKPQTPNHRNEAGKCVARLVKGTKFPDGADGRQTLTVAF